MVSEIKLTLVGLHKIHKPDTHQLFSGTKKSPNKSPTCSSKECDLLHGECVQTYVPYLFLVIPLGPVTLTGQDYVLVESGCACRPKYASRADPDPLSVIPNF